VDGCPPLLPLSESDIQAQLDRRKPGQSHLVTPRKESDRVKILSGVQNGLTLGTPIALIVENTDVRPGDYEEIQDTPRPSHADFTYRVKYGITSASGGGRASARETVARVAAGAIAEKFLKEHYNISIVAWVSSVGNISAPDMTEKEISRADVDSSPVRCPDSATSKQIVELIEKVLQEGDSIGGIVTCVCRNVPAGWGEPVFNKITGELASAMLSIPSARGIEFGAGFASARMKGSEHNDMFVMKENRIGTQTNRSGGIQGGITNGEPVVFRVAFKPPATIKIPQHTITYRGEPTVLQLRGRHDPCVLPRAVPIVEAMTALVLADMALVSRTISTSTH
jgi:chorismate synthase